MSLLGKKPGLQSEVLGPLLAKYLPFHKANYAMFIVDFHCQAHPH
jgi:hypothetical protein